jgi:flagellar protein FlaG
MKDITMIIQNTPQITQAVLPEVRANAARTEPKPVAPPQPSLEELKRAVAAINQAMQQSNRNLEFSVDTRSQQAVVRMVDASTGELIRQFPSETALEISRGIEQFQQGMLLKQKA